jgi:hypothetical protein
MTTLTIVTEQDRGLKPLLRSAIENEMRLLAAGAARTERRIREFERRYELTTDVFLTRYESGALRESLDFDEWVGEHRTLARLHENQDALKGLRIED